MQAASGWDFSRLEQAGRTVSAAAFDPHELAEVAYLEVSQLIPVDFFQLGIFEANRYRTLILIQDGDRVENKSFKLDPEMENLFSWVRRTGDPLLIENFEEEREDLPAQPSYEAEDPPLSGLFIPLSIANSSMGILALQSRNPSAFTEEHQQLLTILSHSLAAALTHILLRKESEHLALNMVFLQEISRLLMALDPLSERLQQVLGLIMEVLKLSGAVIFEIQDDMITSHAVAGMRQLNAAAAELPALVQKCFNQQSMSSSSTPVAEGVNTIDYEYALPLSVVDHPLGVLSFRSARELDLEGEQGNILEMLAQLLSFAMLEARNYDAHQEEAWMTTVLLEVARHAAQPGDTLEALQAVLQLTTLLAGTDWALLLLPDEPGENLGMGVQAGFRRHEALAFEALQIGVQEFNLPIPIQESDSPSRIELPSSLSSALGQTKAQCLKLSDGETLLGLLLLQDNPLPGIRPSLLAGIGHQVSLRLENARLIEDAALRRSLERELAMARDIQSSFLPEAMPAVPGWEIASAWKVAREVGGDFYDIIPLPADGEAPRWGIVIADVADKGIPAALYMSLCRTMLRSVAQTHILPGRCLEIVNQQLISDTRADLFVSAFYGIWEPASAKLIYANAGHLPPFLFKPGKRVELLREHGMVLGVMAEQQYADQTIELSPGDLLVLFTDGVSEAHNNDYELFGFQRLENLVLSAQEWNAETIAGAILDRVINFSGGRDLSDDLTTLAIRRVP